MSPKVLHACGLVMLFYYCWFFCGNNIKPIHWPVIISRPSPMGLGIMNLSVSTCLYCLWPNCVSGSMSTSSSFTQSTCYFVHDNIKPTQNCPGLPTRHTLCPPLISWATRLSYASNIETHKVKVMLLAVQTPLLPVGFKPQPNRLGVRHPDQYTIHVMRKVQANKLPARFLALPSHISFSVTESTQRLNQNNPVEERHR